MFLSIFSIMKMKKHSRAIWNMEDTKQTVYIIDSYSKYSGDTIVSTFIINGKEYALKEVELNWGIPLLSSVEEDAEQPYFKLYTTIDEAKEYIRQLKQLEGARF